MPNILIGVDIGTTGCRAAAYRPDGSMAASRSLEYPLYTPHSGWAEQDAEETWRAFVSSTAYVTAECKARGEKIDGLCFSSVFHSLMPIDAEGRPLNNLLVWADTRSWSQSEKIKRELDAGVIYQRTGCPIHPMYPLSKILWFREARPGIFRRAARFISVKEFILQRLLGRYLVDRSIASGTGIFNLDTLGWDAQLLQYLEIDETQLSTIHATTHTTTGLTTEAVDRLGMDPSVPIILGAGDGVLSNIGSGAVNPGQVTAMIGTSGAVRVFNRQPLTDLKARTWCYNATDNLWLLGGAINNGGIAFRWIRDKLGETEQRTAKQLGLDVYEILAQYAEKIPAGSDGLLILPYFSGERSPYWNADARGVIFGLNLNHGKPHLIRATLEGVAFCMFSVYEALSALTVPLDEIRASGSFIRSRLWVQILSDVFGRTITVPGEPEGAAFGASLLGRLALDQIGDIHEAGKLITIKEMFRPHAEHHSHYQELYGIYKRVYQNLQEEFSSLTAVQRSSGREKQN